MLRLLLRWPLPYAKPVRKAKNHTRAFTGQTRAARRRRAASNSPVSDLQRDRSQTSAAAGTAVPAACSGNMLDSSDSVTPRLLGSHDVGVCQCVPLGEQPLSLPISNMYSILSSPSRLVNTGVWPIRRVSESSFAGRSAHCRRGSFWQRRSSEIVASRQLIGLDVAP